MKTGVDSIGMVEKQLTWILTTAALVLLLGVAPSFGDENFKGVVDEVKVFNRALTAVEVTSLVNTGSAAAPALMLHWNLDETSGAVAADNSGKGNQGAVMGNPAWTTSGKIGGALNFSSTGDFVTIGSVTGLSAGNQAHSITAWIKINERPAPGSYAWILSLGRQGAGAHHWLINAAGKMQLGVCDGGQMQPVVTPLQRWIHVAMTYDGVKLCCYLDTTKIKPPEYYWYRDNRAPVELQNFNNGYDGIELGPNGEAPFNLQGVPFTVGMGDGATAVYGSPADMRSSGSVNIIRKGARCILEMDRIKGERLNILVTDLRGKVLFSKIIGSSEASGRTTLLLPDMRHGTYLIKASGNGVTVMLKNIAVF